MRHRSLSALAVCLLLVGAGCFPGKAPPVEKPAAQAPAPAPQGPAQPPADIRVTAITASTNPTGRITEEGCEGPSVDLVLTVKNFGIDFPTEAGLQAWKTHIEGQIEQKKHAYETVDETPIMGVVIRADFNGVALEERVMLLIRDLPEGRLRNGEQMDVRARLLVPGTVAIHDFAISGEVSQSSPELLPTGSKGMLEPHKSTFTLILPDILPGDVQITPKDGKASMIVGITNRGEVPTTNRVEVRVDVPNKQGGSSMSWTERIGESFLGSRTVGPTEVMPIIGEPDYDRVEVSVIMLCPSAPFSPLRDADPTNDLAVRKATTK